MGKVAKSLTTWITVVILELIDTCAQTRLRGRVVLTRPHVRADPEDDAFFIYLLPRLALACQYTFTYCCNLRCMSERMHERTNDETLVDCCDVTQPHICVEGNVCSPGVAHGYRCHCVAHLISCVALA